MRTFIETNLVYLVAFLIGFVIAECFWSPKRRESVLLIFLGWIGILYFGIYAAPPLLDQRVWARSASFPVLYIIAIILGIVVRSFLSQAFPDEREPRIVKAIGLSAAVGMGISIAVALLLIADNLGQFLYFFRVNAMSFAKAIPVAVVFGLLCAVIALKGKRTWIAWIIGAIPILAYYNAWITVPLAVGYILGCARRTSEIDMQTKAFILVISCVLSFVGAFVFDGYVSLYRLGGPEVMGALMFPWLFISGALLSRISAIGSQFPVMK